MLESNKKGRYPRAALTGATIYHYGWARPERHMNEKNWHIQRYWNKAPMNISYGDIDPATIREFKGTHPAAIRDWLPDTPAPLELNPGYRLSSRDKKQRIKMIIEKLTNLDLSKKHFKLIDEHGSK